MMSSVEVLVCDKDDLLWDEYYLLLMRRYQDLGLPYQFDMMLSFIGNPIVSGNALIVRTLDSVETIGAMGFVFGTGADYFTDESICQIEIVYIESHWRHTRVLALMLLKFVEYIKKRHRFVERIQFWSPADRPDLHRLFTKFCDCIKTNERNFGRISLYQTTTTRISEYVRKFQKVALQGEYNVDHD